MDRERVFVRGLVSMDVYGGRVLQRDLTTLVLLDVPVCGDLQSRRVRAAFPSCSVTYAVSQNSLSGFMVIIHRHEQPLALWWVLFLCACGAGLLYMALRAREGM